MEKKALKYLIILLVIPLIISVIIAITTGAGTKVNSNYDSINGTVHNGKNTYSYDEKIRSSSTYIYLSVFSFVIIGAGVWIYVKQKGNV